MTKQQEIRERAIKSLMAYKGYDRAPTEYIIDHVLADLHSQGVVIWVDRELPEILAKCCCETHPELAEMGEVGDGKYHACEDYQERMLEAGYVAVEPLVGEGK